MRDSLIDRGVETSAIIIDGKGYRTFYSVWHVMHEYHIKTFTIISQKFHNEQALAEYLLFGMHNVIGYNAVDVTSNMAIVTYVRDNSPRERSCGMCQTPR